MAMLDTSVLVPAALRCPSLTGCYDKNLIRSPGLVTCILPSWASCFAPSTKQEDFRMLSRRSVLFGTVAAGVALVAPAHGTETRAFDEVSFNAAQKAGK